MSVSPALVSIGDHGVLNRELPRPLSDVWLDRDLGWLDFNDRVLAEALDERTPLLERAKFLAIFTSNLDEFFMKRVAILRSGSTPERVKLQAEVRDRLVQSLHRQADCFRSQLVPEMTKEGIHLRKWDDLTPNQQDEAGRYFDAEISPALTPLVFDAAHAFPFLANLSTSLAFLLQDPQKEVASYARVKVPAALKQWVSLAGCGKTLP
jgi:polyphosphate kinase